MFARLLGESFARNPRRKLLTAAALMLGMAVTTATLTVALDVGDRLAREFRSLGANLLVTPKTDTLPVEIGGVDYRPVGEGGYLPEGNLGKLKTIFWRHNVLGFTPFLDAAVRMKIAGRNQSAAQVTLVGTWYQQQVAVPGGDPFVTGVGLTHPWWKIRGRWFGSKENECVVGDALAGRYGISAGDTLELSAPETADAASAALRVTGLVSTGGAEDEAVLAPLEIAQKLSGQPGRLRRLFVSALTKPEDAFSQRNPDTMTPTEFDRWYCSPYISSIGRQIQEVLPGTDVQPIRRVAETEGRVLTRVGSLLWLVTLAALVAAALAVGATSASAVLERRSEIGLMKALGATNALVSALFLGEQVLLALAGGGVGFAVGLLLARALGRSVFGVPATPRMILLPVVLGLAALVAVAGSMASLRQAVGFEPAAILRDE